MSTPSPADVAQALAAYDPPQLPALPGRRNHLPAAVLVPLIWTDDGLGTVLTLRGSRLRTHAGEVSWAGGKPEPQDADLAATAQREAQEEIGLTGARVLGRLSAMPLYTSDYRLHPFVAQVDAQPLVPDGHEVDRVLPVDMAHLLDAAHIDAIAYQLGGQQLLSPIWELDEGVLCFGGTAHTLLELLGVVAPLYGRRVPALRTGRFEWGDVLGG